MKTFHMSIAKHIFLDLVKEHGLKCFLNPGQFENKEQAVELVKNDPRQYFIIGSCDNQDENGCRGHEEKEEK